MKGKKELPNWAKHGPSHWEYYGQKRPSFAIEPKKGQESVWDYPRPPKIEYDSRKITVKYGDILIAKTVSAIRILETASPPTFYIPIKYIDVKWLQKTAQTSRCEWKGEAVYWDLIVYGQIIHQVAWSYESPFEDFKDIAGFLSFYPSKMECYIEEERVRPQPGGFYGGWITNEIVGPVKGEDPRAYL